MPEPNIAVSATSGGKKEGRRVPTKVSYGVCMQERKLVHEDVQCWN